MFHERETLSMATKETLVETFLLSRLLDRVQHEDNLLVQRTLTFLTGNTLLIFGLSVGWTAGSKHTLLNLLIVLVGIFISAVQFLLGTVSDAAISFWRHYAGRAESSLGLLVDSAFFSYCANGSVTTPVGEINALKSQKTDNEQNLFQRVHAIVPSTNAIVAIVLPAVIYLFWNALLVYFLGNRYPAMPSWLLTFVFIFLLLAGIAAWFVAKKLIPVINVETSDSVKE